MSTETLGLNSVLGHGCFVLPLQSCVLGRLYDMDDKWKKGRGMRYLLF